MRELLDRSPGERCLGLIAAADALKLGHVNGVTPHVQEGGMGVLRI